MGTESLFELLDKTSDIEKLLTTANGNGIPWHKTILKTIRDKPEFVMWKTRLKYALQEAPQDQIIKDTIAILDNGFLTGFTDEKDFRELKERLNLIASRPERYDIENNVTTPIKEKPSMKKGTTIKTAFDEYTLIEQVGSGGNGRVFSASNSAGEQFAIKLLERNIGRDKLKRFRNEIAFCEQHQHKNIISILDRGYVCLDEKDYVFYVMPLYFESLKKKIKNGIPHENILDIFIGLLQGLKYSHEQRSIHRDIKPENIMFAEGSLEPIICDFGIAHFAEEDLLTIVETKATDRMANFQYAAPEQRKRGGNICFQTDIYALALILNEMFTGEVPQAAGHKRIADVNEEYKYLDDLFDLLFKQDPNERLYPEDAILSELRVLTEQYKRNKETERLKAVVNEIVVPEEFNPSITNLEYINDSLLFTLDSVFSDEWFRTLKNGNYNHSWSMGCNTHSLRKISDNQFSMPIRGDESAEIIKNVVENIKNWVATASREYSQEAKRQAIVEQRQKEDARIAEIIRLEKENEINATLNAVLKDLL